MGVKRIVIEKTAQKVLRRMPANRAATLVAKIEQYAAEPARLANNVEKLQGREGYRLRVGDWRVLFREDAETVTIVDIGPRGGVYG